MQGLNTLRQIGAALLAVLALSAAAGPLTPGQPLPGLQIMDQHEQPWRITSDTRLVIFAAGRKASNLVMEVLAPQPEGFLSARHAVYLADMSRMPGFITRTFALPVLRDQKFRVGVSLDEALLTDWPRQDGAVTLIRLEQGRVVSHEYLRSEDQLAAALGL